MRFRSMAWKQSLVWIGLSFTQIASAVERIRRHLSAHGDITLSVVALLCWTVLLIMFAWAATQGGLELAEESLNYRLGFARRKLLYRSIVGVRLPRSAKGSIMPRQVELEVAQLAPEIYPHAYVVLGVAEPDVFAEALHQRAPQALYEPA